MRVSLKKQTFFALALAFLWLFSFNFVQAASPPTLNFSANPTTITKGEVVALAWSTTNASSCVASGGWSGYYLSNGVREVRPTANTLFVMTCSGPGGTISSSANVIVTDAAPTTTPPPASSISINLDAQPSAIAPGNSVVLSWNTTGAASCQASGGWSDSKTLSGTETVFPPNTTTYTLICSNSQTSSSASRTVTVQQTTSAPTPSPAPVQAPFSASCAISPSAPRVGDTVTFAAGTAGGTGVISYLWAGAVTGEGITRSAVFNTAGLKTATFIATDSAGRTAQGSCSVTVAERPAPTPAPAPAPRPPVVPARQEPNYDAVCRDLGFVKKSEIELASATTTKPFETEQEKQPESFLASLVAPGGNTPLIIFGIMMFIMFMVFIAATITYIMMNNRKEKRI